jgi:hypothetical protein|tara:strand:+ start:2985 stop:3371 length:387 start_codon:yes stop_codon:yes gene_type:complete
MALYPPPSSGGSSGGTTTAATAATAVETNWITIGHNSSNNNALYTVPSGKVFIGTLQGYHGIKINGTGNANYYNGTTGGGKVTTLPAGTVVYPGYADGNWKYVNGVEIPSPTTHADSMVYTATGPNSQ